MTAQIAIVSMSDRTWRLPIGERGSGRSEKYDVTEVTILGSAGAWNLPPRRNADRPPGSQRGDQNRPTSRPQGLGNRMRFPWGPEAAARPPSRPACADAVYSHPH